MSTLTLVGLAPTPAPALAPTPAAKSPRRPRNSTTMLFFILSEPARQDILRCLAEGPIHVHELAECCGRQQQNVSGHLTILKLRGLVRFERDGKRNAYELTTQGRRALAIVEFAADLER